MDSARHGVEAPQRLELLLAKSALAVGSLGSFMGLLAILAAPANAEYLDSIGLMSFGSLYLGILVYWWLSR